VTPAVVPACIEAIDRREAPMLLRANLIAVLTRLGPPAREAVPAIVRVLRSTEARGAGRSALPHVPPASPGRPGPRMVDGLDAYNAVLERVNLRRNAVLALGRIAPGAPSAAEAISALVASIEDPDDEVNLHAIDALAAFGPAARSTAPALMQGLRLARKKKDLWRAGRIVEALTRIDPHGSEADEAVAFLVEVLGIGDLQTRLFTERILAAFGPAAAPAIPRLVALSRQPGAREQEEAAVIALALGQIAPGTPGEDLALSALLDLVWLGPGLQRMDLVVESLPRFGPGAAAALTRVRELSSSGDPRVSGAARKAAAALENPDRRADGAAQSSGPSRAGPPSPG
jgi:HEAT repeat protein